MELIGLAAVAGEHLLVLGPPGTAKSEAVRRVAAALGGRYFEYLLGRFTEPSEVFGPVDLRRLRDGVVETEVTGMLPEAELAFLDEVFLGSTAILNTLLGILNERRFRRGHTDLACPLRLCVGASNGLPEDEGLNAFADRFLLRYFADPVADPMLEDLLQAGWQGDQRAAREPLGFVALDRLAARVKTQDLSAVRPQLAEAIRRLRKEGVQLSDRRAVRVQRLIAAAAALAGREAPSRADLWPIVFAVPTEEGQARAREVLSELLSASQNPTLAHATELAAAGPAARAESLHQAGRALLDDADRSPPAVLRMEGVLREMDASFAQLPPSLLTLRSELAQAVEASAQSES